MSVATDDDYRSLLMTAERAVGALSGSLADKPDDTSIQTDARSLRGIASVVDGLRTRLGRCGGADCMGHSRDGIRTWVRNEELSRASRRADKAESRATMLEAALAQIVAYSATPDDELSMMWDWRDIAAQMATRARTALEQCGRTSAQG